MHSQITLSRSQETAVTAPWRGTINMVLSTAGSGKTLTLTRRAVWIASELVREHERNARLLCVCFNKSAADEMHERIEEELEHQNLSDDVLVTKRAISYINKVTIEVRTFHALGFWVLRTSTLQQRQLLGYRQGSFKLVTGKDLHEIVLAALREAGEVSPSMTERAAMKHARTISSQFSDGKRKLCDMQCQANLQGDEPPDVNRFQHNLAAYERYEERMQQQNAIEYTDMICKPVKLAMEHAGIRSKLGLRFAAVLVDEFQDMSPSDFALCKFFVDKSKSLTVVGDDDQRIYGFRSSKTWFCHETIGGCFTEQVKVFFLPENRRCPGAVVKAADAVIKRNARRQEKNVAPVRPSGCPVRIVGCKTERLEIRFLIRRIKMILPKVRESGEQILVLFRINDLLKRFQKELNGAGIETSRVVVDSEKKERVGPKTLAIFALISLMSQHLDHETFIWASITVSPSLEREVVQEAVAHENEGEVKQEGLNKREDPKKVEPDGLISNEDAKETEPEESKPSSYSSSLLQRLAEWYRKRKESTQTFPYIHAFYNLLAPCEKLNLHLRTARSMEDLVRSAESIISEQAGDAFDLEPEELSSQQDPYTFAEDDETMAGFSIILDAVKDLDEELSQERRNNPALEEHTMAPQRSEADDNIDDFSALFGKDEQARKTKRRKTFGTLANKPSEQSIVQLRKQLQAKLDELCNDLTSKLLATNKETSRPHSRNSRATTVLSTIHKAKGSQFAYVFLCGADKHNLPNGSDHLLSMGIPLDLHSPEVEEERRMFFVSLTRTQNEFTCSYHIPSFTPRSGDLRCMQSPFLQELIEGVDGDSSCINEMYVQTEDELQVVLDFFK